MNNKLSLLVNFIGVDKMSGALKNIVGLGGKGSKSLRDLTGDARKLTRDLQSVQREIAKGSGNVTQLVERERDLERQLEATNKQMERQRHLAAIDADKAVMKRRGDELKDKGRDNVVGGAALAAPFILAVKGAADFQDGMIDIQQKAGLTAAQTLRMQNSIVAAAAAAKQLPESMRQGVDVLAGYGMDPQKAAQIIAPLGRFVTAYRADMGEVAQATYAGIDNLKIPLSQVNTMLDIMAFAGKAGAFEVKDLAATMPSLSAAYQSLGQTGAGAFAQLSAGAEIARKGAGDSATAGNNLLNLLNKLTSADAIKNFAKQGIDLEAALKKSKDPLETIVTLTQKATGGDTMKLNTLFQDQQVLGALRPLMANLPEYRKMRDQALAATGETDRDFAVRAGAANANFRALMGNVSAISLTVGATLLPILVDASASIGSMAQQVGAWAQANPELASGLVKGAAALIGLRVGLGVVQYALGAVIGPLGSVISIARRAGPVLGLLRTAALFMGQGFLRAGAMMLANPIVLIITGIVVALGAAAYLVYTHWDKISAACKAGVAWVKGAIAGLPDWMRNIGSMMMQGLLLAINPMALGKKLIDMAKYGIQQFKAYLGIKSPSRVFMALGGHVAGGLERGIDGNRHGPARAAGRMAAGVAAAGALAMAAPAAGARRPAQAMPTPTAGDSYHLHIQQRPDEDAEALCRRLMAMMEQAKARKARSSYDDGR